MPLLHRADVVDGAVELLDAEGLDGLTTRKLGASLNVDGSALYRHFPNKEALLEAIAAHPEIGFAAATTGPSNLLVIAACRDVDSLYDFLERGIGNLPGIRQLESAPVIRNSKRVGAVQASNR